MNIKKPSYHSLYPSIHALVSNQNRESMNARLSFSALEQAWGSSPKREERSVWDFLFVFSHVEQHSVDASQLVCVVPKQRTRVLILRRIPRNIKFIRYCDCLGIQVWFCDSTSDGIYLFIAIIQRNLPVKVKERKVRFDLSGL